MSKAFTKEDENELELLDDSAEAYTAPPGGKNYLTPFGYRRLKKELDYLALEIWPTLAADYRKIATFSPEKKSLLIQQLKDCRRRMQYLESCLAITEVLRLQPELSSQVQFGSIVEVRESGKQTVFQIVGIEEADSAKGKISWLSPLALALIEGKVGDFIDFDTPGGSRELEILKIENNGDEED